MASTQRTLRTIALLTCTLLLQPLVRPARGQEPTALIQSAVHVIGFQFSPSPFQLVTLTGKPLPGTGSWTGTGTLPSDQTPIACLQPQSCIRVLYRLPDLGISCSWTLAVLSGPNPKAEPHDPPYTTHFALVDLNEDAAHYTVRTHWFPGEPLPAIVRKTGIRPPSPPARNETDPTRQSGVDIRQPNEGQRHTSDDPVVSPVIDRSPEKIKMQIFVKPNGSVDGAILREDSGSKRWRENTLSAVKTWQFAPQLIGVRPTGFRFEFVFEGSIQ